MSRKILILRFSSIGDIVLTTPVIRALKTQLPGAEIHYCTKAGFRSILQHNPYIDKLHLLEKDMRPLLQALRAEKFDHIIDLHHNLRTLRIKWQLGVRATSFRKLNFAKWLLVNFKINVLPDIHIVDRYLETAVSLGVVNDGKGLDYFIPPADRVDTSLVFPGGSYTAFCIGGQHHTKKLPVARMIELCGKIGGRVILLGGKEDGAAASEIEAHFAGNPGTLIFNACGKFNLNQSASLVQQAVAVYTHDTGLMHMAAAFGKKVYSIWGNTVPEFGMYPYKTDFEVLERKGLSCRPCSKIGYNRCPKGHFKCMNEIVFDLAPKAPGMQ